MPEASPGTEKQAGANEQVVAQTDTEQEEQPEELETQEPEENGDKSSRRHGRSFIYRTLEDAEKDARKIDENARRMNMTMFARALGHPGPVFRFKSKLGALQDYGLVRVENDDVLLTDLAVEMLYGPNEQVRLRARATAFLSYGLFKEIFVQCPKNQDQLMSHVDDFVRVTLRIVNEREMFLKRFLQSAAYAGLLDGEPDPKAKTIRLRPAVAAAAVAGETPQPQAKATEDQWVIVAPDDVGSLLDGLGLAPYRERCDVSQLAAGEFKISMADGKITVEVRRPQRVVVRTTSANMLTDVTEIFKALQSKGFKA